MHRAILAAAAASSLSTLAWAQVSPTNVTASVTVGDDTSIDLSWSGGSGDGYYVYRLNPTPIRPVGSIVTGGSDTAGVNWNSAGNTFDGDYGTGAFTSGSPNFGANDYIDITLPAARRIGAIGVLGALQPTQPNWVRQTGNALIDGNAVGAPVPMESLGRNWYRVPFAGTPVEGTTVRFNQSGFATDGRTAVTEIDLWEFERIATVTSGTTFTDTGRTPGDVSTYFVTAYTGSTEGTLNVPVNTLTANNVAAIRAGDRDDTTSSNLSGNFQRGTFEGLPGRAQVPDAATGLVDGPASQISFNASPTEAGTGDVKKYLVFRGKIADTAAIQTNGTLVSKREMNGMQQVVDGDASGVSPDYNGNRAYNNYSESDDIVDFGDGNYHAMVQVRVHMDHDGGNPQHSYRNGYLETSGHYVTDANPGTPGVDPIDFLSINNYTTANFQNDDSPGTPRFAEFSFAPKANGLTWAVGDSLTFHLGAGENSIDHAEYEILGIELMLLGEVLADGSSTYSFTDMIGGLAGEAFDYFIVAEDFAGNQGLALVGSAVVPEPGVATLLGAMSLLALRRRK